MFTVRPYIKRKVGHDLEAEEVLERDDKPPALRSAPNVVNNHKAHSYYHNNNNNNNNSNTRDKVVDKKPTESSSRELILDPITNQWIAQGRA